MIVSRDDILQVRSPGVCFHVLRAGDGLYLIDCGFIGGRRQLARALKRHSWPYEPIRGILITHGHLDHIFNAAAIARESGAWIAAPRGDALHCEGRHPYQGPARVCGILEKIGRQLFRDMRFPVDQWLDDGTDIPIWEGLRAVHLPGHTDGHMGFYCSSRRLLFSGDLFASHGFPTHLPPAIFNDRPEEIPASIARALSLDLEGVLPNHCDRASPATHLSRLRRLHRRIGNGKPPPRYLRLSR